MRKGLAALAIALLAAAPAAGSSGSKPRLRLLDTTPLRIAGSSFKARERVTVTVYADGMRRRTTRATSGGAFVVTFPGAAPDRCAAVAILARGASGDQASLKVMPKACPPALRRP
jgi:hypothetical protein